jgi:hypothetical protein
MMSTPADKRPTKHKPSRMDGGYLDPSDAPKRFYRKVIRITAGHSPNVRYAKAQIARGLKPTGDEFPGVLTWDEYVKRRATWDKVRQCVGLDAEFWEGASALMYPPDWLNHSEELSRILRTRNQRRVALAIGVDPGEGEANTSISVVDWYGLIEKESMPTPNTAVIPGWVMGIARRHNMEHLTGRIVFDAGGGGKQIVDRMRADAERRDEYCGITVVGFNEKLVMPPRYGQAPVDEREENMEEKYTYLNRRIQMYDELSLLIDPEYERPEAEPGWHGFAIPEEYTDLRQQLAPVPRLYDGEGRMYLPPKNRKDAREQGKPAANRIKTMTEIIGCSPDESDSLVLAVHRMLYPVDSFIVTAE